MAIKETGYGPEHALIRSDSKAILARHELAITHNEENTKWQGLEVKPGKGNWLIEEPHLPNADIYVIAVRNMLLVAMKDIDPQITDETFAIRFVPNIYIKNAETDEVKSFAGQFLGFDEAETRKKIRRLIEVSLESLESSIAEQPQKSWIYFAIFTVLHELYEYDHFLGVQKGKIPSEPSISEFDENYVNAYHELYANEKAAKLIQKVLSSAPENIQKMIDKEFQPTPKKSLGLAIKEIAGTLLRHLSR